MSHGSASATSSILWWQVAEQNFDNFMATAASRPPAPRRRSRSASDSTSSGRMLPRTFEAPPRGASAFGPAPRSLPSAAAAASPDDSRIAERQNRLESPPTQRRTRARLEGPGAAADRHRQSKAEETRMERRKFIQAAGMAGIRGRRRRQRPQSRSPARSQVAADVELPEERSTPSTAPPKSSPRRVAEATDNKFQIQVFAAGEIVPGLQAAGCRAATARSRCATPRPYYYFGKDPTFAFGTRGAVRAQQPHAERLDVLRRRHRADERLLQEVQHLSASRPAIPGRRWAAGSARRSRRSPISRGSRCAIGGFAGASSAKLGVVPQQIAGGDIYPALEKGTHRRRRVGRPLRRREARLQKVAQYYYYPGWWEGGPMLHNFINIEKWNALPPAYKSMVRTASSMANEWMQARYDARQSRRRSSGWSRPARSCGRSRSR